jgi:hypothetical protein
MKYLIKCPSQERHLFISESLSRETIFSFQNPSKREVTFSLEEG